MKQTIGFREFCQAFEQLRPQNFSGEGLGVLWDYLEQHETDTGVDLELDVIAICCDFSEDDWESIAQSYSIDLSGLDSDEYKIQAVADYLMDEGAYVGHVEGGFVYRPF